MKKHVDDNTETTNDLNIKQEKFCQLYASDREFFGNGVESYIEAYNPETTKSTWYRTACSAASRLLTNVKVIVRINEILEADGLNDNFVDKQLVFIIKQHADFGAKMAAIREYNKLKARITEKTEHSGEQKIIVETRYADNNNPTTLPISK